MPGFADESLLPALTPAVLAFGLFLVMSAVWPQPTAASRPIAIAIGLVFMAQYAWWRLTETLPAPALTGEYAIAAAFLVAEMGGMLAAALSLVFLTQTRSRSADADANAAWLAEEARFPRVDVLICSYNEERAILERTIVGALAMDYPNFRVFMLDDGRRDWLKILCARLGCRYVSRPDNRHAKAGNINHALKLIAALPGPPDFVAILDADFVPTPRFLKRAMTLFRDPKIGVVQTPQHFVNPDPIQINLGATKFWPDEQRYFFDVVMPAKDAWSAAFCCGTSSIIRLAPLLAIGGFPTDSVTEDYLLTLRLKEKGALTAYLNEPLTFGLAPEGLKEYVTQRSRWCLGFMQIARGRSGPFSRRTSLAWFDRLSLVEVFLNWTAVYVSRAFGLVVPILSLAFDVHPFQASVADVAVRFLPFWLWSGLSMRWLSNGRIVPILSDVSHVMVAPQILRAAFAGLLRPQGRKFVVTAKGGDRTHGFVEWGVMRPFVVLIALSLAAVAVAFYVNPTPDTTRYSLALFWTWYNLVVLTVLCFVCVERPRMRAAERFAAHDLVKLMLPEGAKTAPLADLSITGARIFCKPPRNLGESIDLELAGVGIAATIVRVEAETFAVAFARTFETRIAMTRLFYSGEHLRPLDRIRLLRVGAAVLRRVLD
ncbi:MAG TPA: glycosyltransferase [Roseiarcus sp.]|nr:glycosyltransferase [Roseiarcus sp.]